MKIKFHKILIGLGVGLVLSLSSCGLKNPFLTSKINPTEPQEPYTFIILITPSGSVLPYPISFGVTKIYLKNGFSFNGVLSKTQCLAEIKNSNKIFPSFGTIVCIKIKIFNQMKESFQPIGMGDNFAIHVKGFNSLQSCRTYTKGNGTCYRFYKVDSLIQMKNIISMYKNGTYKNY